jgi:hypothetical protein
VAAVGLTDQRVVADPFVPTAEVVGLLQIRANQLAPRTPRTRFARLRRLLRGLRPRPAAMGVQRE